MNWIRGAMGAVTVRVMDAWLVALVSGGLTLSAALITTYLNGRVASRNLRLQLESEEKRHRAQLTFEMGKHESERTAVGETRIFDHQRESAIEFLSSMASHRRSAASMLGAKWAWKQTTTSGRGSWEDEEALEDKFGYTAARTALSDAESATSIYLPDAASSLAREAMRLEIAWTDAVLAYYERDAPDPGSLPPTVDHQLDEFRREVKQLLGVVSQEGQRPSSRP